MPVHFNPDNDTGLAACQDGSDNDYDGYVDGDDWDCRESMLAACTDGLDNDGDGYADLDDLDCSRDDSRHRFSTPWGKLTLAVLGTLAEIYIGAFLAATLHGESGYRPLFRDHRRAREWLPDTIYISQYEDATTQPVSTYHEDINVATTTLPGGTQVGENLAVWREQLVEAKWGDMDNHAVYLGWDTDASATTARYTIQLPERGLTLTQNSVLVFALADANQDPTPETKDAGQKGEREPIDLTAKVVDSAGEVARLPLSHFSFLQPQLEGRIGKAAFMSPLPKSEVVFQHFEFPLAAFATANPAFDPTGLAQVRFVFDRTPVGVVALDDIGFCD